MFLTIGLIFFCLASIFLAGKFIGNFLAEKSWVKVKGKVKSRINERISEETSYDCTFRPNFQIEYEVNKEIYICRDFNLLDREAPRFFTESEADGYMKSFKVGNEVECFYNPKNPKRSVIFLDCNYFRLFLMVLFCCWATYGCYSGMLEQ